MQAVLTSTNATHPARSGNLSCCCGKMALTVSVADPCQGTVFVCQGVDMPDIEVQITTLVRIALVKLQKAREDGNAAQIVIAQRRFDQLCDKLADSYRG